MAPSTPPPPASAEFAALTIASAGTRVISPVSRRSLRPVALVHSRGMAVSAVAIISSMTRRDLLAVAAAGAAPLWGRNRITKGSISAITDEIGKTTDDAIAFAHQYGLQYIELRSAPGERKEYVALPEEKIKAHAVRFASEGLKVSFLNTGMLKYAWPGMEPVRRRPESDEARAKRTAAEKVRWDERMESLKRSIRCAQTMGCDKVRVFTGSRVAEPA